MNSQFDTTYPASPPRAREAVERMKAYVPGEQPTDPEIVKLNTNEFPYPPAPEVLEAIRREAADSIRKYPDPLCTRLREALAEECDVPPEWILVGNGSDEILRLFFQAYIAPGDAIAVPDPTYSLYPVLAKMFEGRLVEYPTDEEGAFAPEFYETKARMIVIADPNPPLGRFHSVLDTVRLARRAESLLLIDEAYIAFAAHDNLGLLRHHPNVAISRTFSKSHGMAGMRVGYTVARPEVVNALDKIRDSYNVNRVSQAAALAAVGTDAKAYYRAKIDEIALTRDLTRESLIGMEYAVPPSAGNFLFVRTGDGRRTYEALRERKIYVRFFDQPALRDGVRVTIGTPQEMDLFVRTLAELPKPQEARS